MEKIKTKETKPEIPPEMAENCKKAMEQYLELKPEEKILLLVDRSTNAEVAELLRKSLTQLPNQFEEIFVSEETDKQTFQEKRNSADIIIRSSFIFVKDFPATKGFFNWLMDAKNKKTRFLTLSDLDNIEIFKNSGAMSENLHELKERLNKMETRLKNTAGVIIKTSYGTNLKVGMRPYAYAGKQWIKCSGQINKPKQWDNWPGGEIFTVPDENKTEGILVLPVLAEFDNEEDKFEQGVDKFVYVKIKKGMIVGISGGKSAEKLKNALEKAASEEKIPWHALQIAEFAFGANSKAKGVVQKLEGPYAVKGTPIIEAEKKLGTIHIAFGDNKIDPALRLERFIEAESHLDFVIPQESLTVETFETHEDFEKEKNGRKVINQGSWNF